ncbi:SDR family NAD(P)-dependent oxidoreductase [Microbacterium aerolatum]|uniref:SDR family NAD(P)-dependent oxidoreductase n=1 Tax=Microbacterium aerolatum TaxID=153731 RepID=UPI00384A7C82
MTASRARLAGSTALVTGGSDGVGLEIVRMLADAGADVIMPVRNRAKGEVAIERIRRAVPDARIVLRASARKRPSTSACSTPGWCCSVTGSVISPPTASSSTSRRTSSGTQL